MTTEPSLCLHLHLAKLSPDSPDNQLHQGPQKAYYCHECGSTFFVDLTPATIKVIPAAEGTRCSRDAEWEIVHGLTTDDYTHSCSAHLGEMMTDAVSHEVHRAPAGTKCCFIGPNSASGLGITVEDIAALKCPNCGEGTTFQISIKDKPGLWISCGACKKIINSAIGAIL